MFSELTVGLFRYYQSRVHPTNIVDQFRTALATTRVTLHSGSFIFNELAQ
jgi:hypothetical protein